MGGLDQRLVYRGDEKGVTASDGKVYGVPYNTDSRGLWYNKEIFKRAGLPEDWRPKNWDEVLDAARTIKEKEPDVVPIWMNMGKATGEATSMQTYEMLLYGTGERLYDDAGGNGSYRAKASSTRSDLLKP